MENQVEDNQQQVAPDQVAPSPIPSNVINKVINVVEPITNKLVSIPADQLQDALDDDYRLATREDVNAYKKEQKYGSATQQAITAVEGIAQGAIPFGGAPAFETKVLGVNPEDIRGRQEINPSIHGMGEMAGLVGSEFIPYVGQANLLSKAGKGVSKAAGVAEKAGFLNKISDAGLRGATEMAMYSTGDEIGKVFKEDPEQSAATAITNIGLSGLLGGVTGGALGAAVQGIEKVIPKSFVSEVERPALESGEFMAGVKHHDNITPDQKSSIFSGLRERKANAKEIEEATRALGAEALEGMVLSSTSVQKAEDMLINGAPTIHSEARKALYKDIYNKAEVAASDTLGAKSNYTKAELGNILKENLTNKINEQAAPIEALYGELKAVQEVVELPSKAAKGIADDLKGLREFKISPSSPEGKMVSRVASEIENLRTVEDVKTYRSILNRSISPMAPAGEKRIAAIISDKLADLEEKSIIDLGKRLANTPEKKMAMDEVISKLKEAKKQYKPFIEKVSTLAEGLGKSRVYGKQDALNFINEHLTAENVMQRLSTKGDSAFRQFLKKEFPAESNTVALYQKSLIREAASKDGVLNVNRVLKDISKLPREIQEQIFNKDELIKLGQVKTVMESMPKSFNPSGTSHIMDMRRHFEDPKAIAFGNFRDFAVTKFIKGVGDNSSTSIINKLTNAAAKGEKMLKNGTKAIFKRGADYPIVVAPLITPEKKEKVKKRIDDLSQNPEELLKLHDHPAIPREFAQAFGQMGASAISYLSSLRPNTDKMGALDPRRVPSKAEEAKFDNALMLAESPLTILNKIHNGTLTPDDMKCVSTIYPKLYEQIKFKLVEEIANVANKKDVIIPYKTRISLSMFLTQPLDSTMNPSSIQAAQSHQSGMTEQEKGQAQQAAAPKRSMTALNKMPGMYQTPGQARQANKLKS